MKKDIADFINRIAPARAAEVAARRFKKNFKTESFFETKWKDVKRRQAFAAKKTKSGKEEQVWRSTRDQAGRTRKILTALRATWGEV
jgi:hypothetical protein